jgi:plastocyanin
LWMRTEITLWWLVVAIGVGLYYIWYMGPTSRAFAHPGKSSAFVEAINVAFAPRIIHVKAGATVTWADTQGVHAVDSDQKLFDSGSLLPNHTFRFTFNHVGTFPYYCRFHGARGGIGMAGKIVVTNR